MRPKAAILLPLVLVASLAAMIILRQGNEPQSSPFRHTPGLSDLGKQPDWTELDDAQGVISRDDFVRELDGIFTVGDSWKKFITTTEEAAFIKTGPSNSHLYYRLNFAGIEKNKPARYWKTAKELEPYFDSQPLHELHIALDPGHIGGDMAKTEERWFQLGDDKPVMEGEMTLFTAKLLRKRLEEQGAKVTLVRKKNAPVNPFSPTDFVKAAEEKGDNPSDAQRIAERLFYRTAEIRERARLVNEEIKPDLIICLHYNAVSWGDPKKPTLRDENHLHILLHGALTKGEVANADERFDMIQKIVQRIHPEEKAIAASVAKSFVDASALPPYRYEANSKRAINIDRNPYLWARNLLANRLYRCPVIYMEPYVMNSKAAYKRMQIGDYEGLKTIDGLPRKSIYREYADAVAEGILNYYKSHRPKAAQTNSTTSNNE